MVSADRPASPESAPGGPAAAKPPKPPVVEPEWVEPSPELVELARAYGVAVEYWDQSGNYHRIGAATILAVLTALEVDVSSPDAIWNALYDRRNAPWRRMLPPVFVMRAGSDNQCWVHVPNGDPVSMWVDREEGGEAWFLDQVDRWVEPRHVDGVLVGEATFRLPWDLPLGWHTLWARSEGADGVAARGLLPADRHPGTAGSAGAGRRPPVGLHDAGLRHALGGVVGDRRPRGPGRPRCVERPRGGGGLRPGQPAARRLPGSADGALALPARHAPVRQPDLPAGGVHRGVLEPVDGRPRPDRGAVDPRARPVDVPGPDRPGPHLERRSPRRCGTCSLHRSRRAARPCSTHSSSARARA